MANNDYDIEITVDANEPFYVGAEASVEEITGGVQITCKDKSGTTTATVYNGEKGDTGASIVSIEKTATSGLVDTYTVTLSDESAFEFYVTNGEKGDTGDTGATGNGIASVEKTGTDGLVDTYTITFTDGTTATFTVTNGEKGDTGDKGDTGETGATGATGNGIASVIKTGTSGLVDTYTITFTNGNTTSFDVTNGQDGDVASTNLASTYSSSAIYAVGDYVWYLGALYRCTTAITTAEAWTAGHWTSVALADDASDLKADIDEPIQNQLKWVKGSFDSYYRIYAHNSRLVTCDYIPVCDVSVGNAGRIAVHAYDEHYDHLGIYTNNYVTLALASKILLEFPAAKYLRIIFKRTDETNVELTDVTTYNIVVSQNKLFNAIGSVMSYTDVIFSGLVKQGGFNSSGLDEPTNALRLVTAQYIPVSEQTDYSIALTPSSSASGTLMSSISFYTENDYMTNRASYTAWLNGNICTFKTPVGTKYIRITFGYTNNASITPSAIDKVEVTIGYPKNTVCGYLIDSGLLKQNVSAVLLGNLSHVQSFLKYNGSYYSTNGNEIKVQDSSFVVTSYKDVSAGHGNSFQLGHNGKAYISGWDDNTVYIVTLSSLTVEDTITLPTTGYTTAAIDDINGIAYIFQRDSYPSTEVQYNFIVYDYVNDEILKTSKTIPFSAMQACDFYNDRIIVLNGGGTVSMPNGYRIYNTDGKVIAEYVLPEFSTSEPEGVCLDRDTGELLISFYNSNECYKIYATN